MKEIRVTAPPTGANLGPGFDVLGLAYDILDVKDFLSGDVVTARRTDEFTGVKLVEIINNPDLPLGFENVVQAVGQYVLDSSGEKLGIELVLDKRMPIGSGLGSSASSSVDSAVAVNALLENPFPRNHPKMLEAVVHGEAVATKGLGHADNVFPALLGGVVFIEDLNNYKYRKFLGGEGMYFVVTSPNLRSDTGEMRRALKSAPYDIPAIVKLTSELLRTYLDTGVSNLDSLDLTKLVKESGSIEVVYRYLEGALKVIRGIKEQNLMLLGQGMMADLIVTPIRAKYITGFDDVKDAVLSAGATGFTISGSGPAVLSTAYSKRDAEIIADSNRRAFGRHRVESKVYVAKVDNQGARIV